MGEAWDGWESPAAYQRWCVAWARECWRVLKPGGHLLAFGGTRTYHRMTVAIEDAGFEIRDSLHWIYGSGFPKGQDIAKSIDKRRDDRADTLKVTAWLATQVRAAGWDVARLNAVFGFHARGMATHWITQGVAARVPNPEQWDRLQAELGFDDTDILPLVAELNARRGTLGEAWAQREVVGQRTTGIGTGQGSVTVIGDSDNRDLTAPASDAARQWQGWNTSLKPAHEPIVMARKSTGFNTTVANVLEHGTGALNVGGCRTVVEDRAEYERNSAKGRFAGRSNDVYGAGEGRADSAHAAGRWPTNILLGHGPDCVDVGDCQPGCPVAEMDAQSGVRKAGAHPANRAGIGYMGNGSGTQGVRTVLDSGGSSRFFPVFRYEAKAPASERPRLTDGTAHTTVKPLALMQWLVRLVTPPGGTVLDPFAGSGTTLAAALREDMLAVGVEQHEPYAQLCVQRLSEPYAVALFGDIA